MRHAGKVVFASYNLDDTHVLIGCDDKTSQLWSAEGQPIGEPMRYDGNVLSATFSSKGKRILTFSDADGKTLRIWASDGKPVGEPMSHTGIVQSAFFSLSGTRILTRDNGNHVWLWTGNGQPIGKPMPHLIYHSGFSGESFSPDGSRFLTSPGDGTVRLWSADGEPIGKPMQHDDQIEVAQFSPVEAKVILVSPQRVSLWTANTGIIGKAFVPTLGNNSYNPAQAKFNPNGKHIVVYTNQSRAILLDPDTLCSATDEIASDRAACAIDLVLAEDARTPLAATGQRKDISWDAKIDDNGRLQLVDRVTGRALDQPERRHESVTAIAATPDGTRLVIADATSVRFLETAHWRVVAVFPQTAPITALQFTVNGQRLILRQADDACRIWDCRPADEQQRGWALRQAEYGPAREYAAGILASPVKTGELRAHVQSDQSLSQIRKMLVWDYLKRELDILETQANTHFAELKQSYIADKPKMKVAASDLARGQNSPRVGEILQRLVDEWKPTADELNMAAWQVVLAPERNRSDYSSALSVARQSVEQKSNDPANLNTLGVAYYRIEEYQQAIEVLTRSDELLKGTASSQPNLIFIAMALFRLGQVDEARQKMAELKEQIQRSDVELAADDAAFLKEAEQLMAIAPDREAPKQEPVEK
jgi:tetratricopeptide (TPR) repeat protein